MTEAPEPRLDVAERALSVLLQQFRGKPVFEQVIRSYAAQAQALEIVFWQLQVLRTIDYATGVQLDGLGGIVGEPRLGRPDEEYRSAIRSRIRLNRSFATVEEILALMRLVMPFGYTLTELGYATFELEVVDTVGTPALSAVFTALHRVRAAGVRSDLLFHGTDIEEVFTLASGDTDELDALKGLADDTSTTGGFMADVM